MPAPEPSAPRPIATVGLHASASTWVFNVVRELMIAALGEAHVLGCYADTLDLLPDGAARADRQLVLKSHHGSAGLDEWLAQCQACVFVSVRDPRDACLSMAQRFGAPLEHTVRWIVNDCNRLLLRLPPAHAPLRYEDRFFARRSVVERFAQVLGLRVDPAVITDIFDRYGTEAVRAFAQRLGDLPPERLTRVGEATMDRVTQILGPHIGDARSGKWRDLPKPMQDELTRLFAPFLERFGYQR